MAAPDGTVWGSIVGSYGRIGIYKSISSTDTTTSVTVEVWFWSKYSVSDTANTLYFDNRTSSGSATTSKGSVSISTTSDSGGWSTTNQKKIASYSYSYTRGTSAVTRYLYAKLVNVDRVGGTMYASTTFSVPKLASYTISYNANGGSGAPSSQTKYYGKTLTLSSTKPTRTGYTFQGWATSSSGSVAYAAGASYTANAKATLYAVWKAKTYTVSYNANGGSGAPSSQTKTHGTALTLSSTKPTRTNYTFKGWGTSASSTTVAYAAGASYTANAAITLYAIWELAYTKPRINSCSVHRCNSSGTISDSGTYALVKCTWATDKTVTSIKIEWKLSSASSWTNSTTVSASGTSGTVNTVIGAGALSTDSTYQIRITITDSGGSTPITKPLGGTKFPFDIYKQGTGVAFGKPAESSGYADIGFKTMFRESVELAQGKSIYGTTSDGARCALAYLSSGNIASFGFGGYDAGIGETYVYGKQITLRSTTGTRFYNTTTGLYEWLGNETNKVLYSGSIYLNDTQTFSLDYPISSMAHGIVLVWSKYADGAAKDEDFNFSFIPKHFVSAHGSKGVAMTMVSATMHVVATKYAYISDTSIKGYNNNGAAAATKDCGIITTPRNFVLRYVIGV